MQMYSMVLMCVSVVGFFYFYGNWSQDYPLWYLAIYGLAINLFVNSI